MCPFPVNEQCQPFNVDKSSSSPSSSSSQTNTKINEKGGNENNDTECIIKFEDMFDIEQKIPITTISKLG
jgi:hypothetical protein